MPRPRNIDEANHGRNRNQSQRKQLPSGTAAIFAGWVNYNLPATDKEEFESWFSSGELEKALAAITQHGYKISLGYEPEQEDFFANAFCRNEADTNAGLMVSQRSGDPLRALGKLLFAIDQRMPADWNELLASGQKGW